MTTKFSVPAVEKQGEDEPTEASDGMNARTRLQTGALNGLELLHIVKKL
jgi:hypothetical protein